MHLFALSVTRNKCLIEGGHQTMPRHNIREENPIRYAQVKDISNALEEKDREEFTRLKVIKRSTTK